MGKIEILDFKKNNLRKINGKKVTEKIYKYIPRVKYIRPPNLDKIKKVIKIYC